MLRGSNFCINHSTPPVKKRSPTTQASVSRADIEDTCQWQPYAAGVSNFNKLSTSALLDGWRSHFSAVACMTQFLSWEISWLVYVLVTDPEFTKGAPTYFPIIHNSSLRYYSVGARRDAPNNLFCDYWRENTKILLFLY